MIDICIIGAGASGMAAAVVAARTNPTKRICILEKKETEGKKLLATGNGRCNLTNINCVSATESLFFFESLGVLTKVEEEGRVYPYSGRADSVVTAFVSALDSLDVTRIKEASVTGIEKQQDCFCVTYQRQGKTLQMKAQKVLIATGGKAAPQYGTAGDSYVFARQLGHMVNKTIPALAPVECKEYDRQLKGVRARGRVQLFQGERWVAEEHGEIQFTDEGLSGICILNLSSFIRGAMESGEWKFHIDFAPEFTVEQIYDFFIQKQERIGDGRELLNSVVHQKLAENLLEKAGISKNRRPSQLLAAEIRSLAQCLKGWDAWIANVKGWKFAQCTAGGVNLEEINRETMESNLVEGLYFAGEALDFHGPCGGYNLQHAWETGIKAGKAMATAAENSKTSQLK